MSKMSQVAEILGVALNEPFKVVGYRNGPLTLKFDGLWDQSGSTCNETLAKLLSGEETVQTNFSPRSGDAYYYIDTDGAVERTVYIPSCLGDVLRRKVGNCFRTAEEVTDTLCERFLTYQSSSKVNYFYEED